MKDSLDAQEWSQSNQTNLLVNTGRRLWREQVNFNIWTLCWCKDDNIEMNLMIGVEKSSFSFFFSTIGFIK